MNLILRTALLLCCMLPLIAAAPAKDDAQHDTAPSGREGDADLDTSAEPAEAEPQAEPPAGQIPIVEIPMSDTLRFIIQPTILGLVPPRGPAGYGEVFVRILKKDFGSIAVHYEIKEEISQPDDDETESLPGDENRTRIRRGEITATGIRKSHSILPPLYWGDGDLHTDSSLLWLSKTSYDGLAQQGSCPLDVLDCGPVDSDAAGELKSAVAELLKQAGLDDSAAFTLEKEDAALYPCVVNGERVRLKALHARDSLGLAEYWVLDDAKNPLLLKLTYTLGDAGEQGDMSFIQKGGGYAVTSIDFSPGWDREHKH